MRVIHEAVVMGLKGWLELGAAEVRKRAAQRWWETVPYKYIPWGIPPNIYFSMSPPFHQESSCQVHETAGPKGLSPVLHSPGQQL